AQDQAIRVDFEIYFLFYLLSSKIKEGIDLNLNELGKNNLLKSYNIDDLPKKIINKLKKNSNIYLKKFKKEFVISDENKLFFDWDYRTRVLFDSITISAMDLNKLLEELEKNEQLDLKLKILYAFYFGHDNLIRISRFTDEDEEILLQVLDELVKNEIIYKKPYRLSDIGQKMLKFINEHIQKISSLKISSENQNIIGDLIKNKTARQLSNLLLNLCYLTIKNRREIGLLKDFREFGNLFIDPKTEYK
ncbi:MAG: hypothetical protein ACTSO9_02115, partial [Candidatus Helarchaeota archaeon]